ncbi:MAG: hypothetical protein QXG86_03060 [Candidatus Woesearchaeota archaeon]
MNQNIYYGKIKKKKNVLVIDKEVRKPSENLWINNYYSNLIKNGEYNSITRFYKHKKGVILGANESVEDINIEECIKEGYEVVRRPSGGSVIVVEPMLNLCYSLFFNPKIFGSDININGIYKAITFPLAKNLGSRFKVEGTYYLRYDIGDKKVVVGGHAIKTEKNVIQFDGVINLKKFDVKKLEELIKLRDLYESEGKKYILWEGRFYDKKGNFVKELRNGHLLRSEKKELEQVLGLEDIGLSEKFFISAMKKTIEEIFGVAEYGQIPVSMRNKKQYTNKYIIKKTQKLGEGKKRKRLGHCFVDFVEEETRIF